MQGPAQRGSGSMGIEQFIDNEVKANDVVVFMKGTPQFPQCGFSGQVVQILDYLGVSYKGVNVLESDDLRQGIKAYAQWPTIPQLYVKGEFVGSCEPGWGTHPVPRHARNHPPLGREKQKGRPRGG